MTNSKRGRGRPRLIIDEGKLMDAVRVGLRDKEICETMQISMSSWMRWLRVGDHREQVQHARSGNAYEVWKAVERQALMGRVGAANMILRRLERRV